MKPICLAIWRVVKTGAGNAFCGISAGFKQGGFASGDAAGAGNEGFVLLYREVEVGGSFNVSARVLDNQFSELVLARA